MQTTKQTKRKTLKISSEERYLVYRYYWPNLKRKQLIALLKSGSVEREVIRIRWGFKRRLNESKSIFKEHVEGLSYLQLVKKFGFTYRKITAAISKERMDLIAEIKKDIEVGILKLPPDELTMVRKVKKRKPKKLSDKTALLKWEAFKTKLSTGK